MIDIEYYVDHLPGRPYGFVESELLRDGFIRGRMMTVRADGKKNRKVKFVRGHHENADVIELVHDWKVDSYGVGVPGEVVSAKVIETGARYDYERGF